MAAEDCVVVEKNLGVTRCTKLPALPRCIIETPLNFRFTAAQAIDSEFWQDAMLANSGVRVWLWPFFKGFEDKSEEAVYEENALADLLVRDGKYRFRFMIKEDLCLHKAMFTHRSQGSARVLIYDIENQLTFTETGTDEFAGFTTTLLNTEKLKISDGQVATKSPIYVVLADNKELDANGAIVPASFVNALLRLTDVDLTILAPIADDSVIVQVTAKCDGTPISGLLPADFVFKKTDGTNQPALTGAAESPEGVYTLTTAGTFVDGNVNLRAAALLTVQAYESTGSVLVNIP